MTMRWAALALLSLVFLTSAVYATADVAYIVKNNLGIDQYLVTEIQNNGYSVDVLYEPTLPAMNLSSYRIVIIGDQKLDNPKDVNIEKYRSIILNSYNFYRLSSSNYQLGWSYEKGSITSPAILTVKDLSSPITQGLPEKFRAYTVTDSSTHAYYLKGKKISGVNLLVSSGIVSDTVIASLQPNNTYLNGRKSEQRAVFFGITNTRYWTPESRLAFSNSLNWVLIGEDRDNDGFYSDSDCNDNDNTVYPGADEIPYDGIDQDCDGFDLTDVDNDGYDSDLVGGDDCDDSDAFINPANPDKLYNCINDFPVIDSLNNEEIDETDTLVIEVSASDPDEDSLLYSINDSRFSQSDNVFTWETTYEDAGEYTFTISVTDGNLTSYEYLIVKVNERNRAPFISNLSVIEWDEDSSHSFNISEYLRDEDQDSLMFGIYNTSQDDKISLNISDYILTFSSMPNWTGSDWIVFWISDGIETSISDVITLKVNPINDAPYFRGNIDNIEFDEDTSFHLDLSDYFIDIDSSLSYTVEGTINLSTSLDNDILSLIPPKDWYGEETLVINATDNEFEISSNSFTVTVNNVDETPEFGNISCETSIIEDTSYSCELEATDFENDSITFSVSSQNNLICAINGSTLSYISEKDYNGAASCVLLASDKDGDSEYNFQVNISGINDAPSISSFSPLNTSVTLHALKNQQFSVTVSDIDSTNPQVTWYVNGNREANGRTFTFSKPSGSYILEAIVSDSQLQSIHYWIVIVSDISDLSCSDVSGDICSETETCSGALLGVKDSAMCCSTTCTPKPITFKNANICKTSNSTLAINIKNPKSSDEFELGSTISSEIEITNNFNESLDIDVEAQLYDTSKSKVVEDNSISISIDKSKKKTASIDILIPDDLERDNNYVLLINAESDDLCNYNYQAIGIERKRNDIRIDEFEISGNTAVCGDVIEGSIRLANLGSDDQKVSLLINSEKLNISAPFEDFKLDEYGGNKDTIKKRFEISIPPNAKEGNYTIEANVVSGSQKATESISIFVEGCAEETRTISSSDTDNQKIALNNFENIVSKEDNGGNILYIILGINLIIFIVLVIFTIKALKI